MSPYRSVFEDEAKLDINYVPTGLLHRDEQMRLLREFFGFLSQSPEKMTQRVILIGDVGTGKTALSHRFGADIVRETQQQRIRLHYVHVNCREYRGSLFLILHHVVSVFHPNFPARGYSAEELLRILLQVLDEQNGYVLLTLDEFESLIEREGSEAVYQLTRLQEMRTGKPQRVSILSILRSLELLDRLDASTRSTLQSNIIRLGKYSKQQLTDIVGSRASIAFKPLTVSEDTVNLIAELAYSEGGNARFGIELLWRAGKYADGEDLNAVSPECVRKAISSIYSIIRKDDLAHLSQHEKLLLLGIARFFKENEKAYASFAEAEQSYAVACEEFNEKPYSHTQLWKYLQNLSTLNIIKKSVSGAGARGRSTLIYLPNIPASKLENELCSLLDRKEA